MDSDVASRRGRAVGYYEYNHEFRFGEEIVHLYSRQPFPRSRVFLFEFRTNFILKSRGEEEEEEDADHILDSERFSACIAAYDDGIGLHLAAGYRLHEYWMTREEINNILQEAFDFAKHLSADPKHVFKQSDGSRVTPVVVNLQVCTVQQEDEPLQAATNRALTARKLVPVYLWPCSISEEDSSKNPLVLIFCRRLPRIRVTDTDQGLAMMKSCALCSRPPCTGEQITRLPVCGHPFHSHCLVRSLEAANLCPLCCSTAYDYDAIADGTFDPEAISGYPYIPGL